MEWVAGVCFSSLCAASCDSVKCSARSLGAPESVVSGASGAGSGRFGGSASGQGSVEPASGSLAASGSIKASLFIPGDYPAIYKITHFLQACGLTGAYG